MSTPKDGGPAMPMPAHSGPTGEQTHPIYGMSLRDWFAGMALQGVLASPSADVDASFITFAVASYKQADAMLAAREKVKP